MTTRIALALLLSLSTLAGCGDAGEPERTWLDDDFPAGTAAFAEVGEGLHSPYVLGTSIRLAIQTTVAGLTPSRLEVVSDDPAVLRIDGIEGGAVDATALAIGATTLRVIDPASGDELASAAVEVRAPTRVETYPYAAQTREPATAAEMVEDETLRVLAGGGAIYFVRYFDDETPLAGSHVLGVQSVAVEGGETAPTIERLDAFTFREWLFVQAGDAGGATEVTLRAADRELGSLRVESVAPEAIEGVQLLGGEAGAEEGREVSVLARVSDGEGQIVEGAVLAFELDGAPVEGEGDLFTYVLDRDVERSLRVALPGTDAEATATVHAARGSGTVGSSLAPGCSVAHGARGGAAGALVMLVVAAALVLRRRRAVG